MGCPCEILCESDNESDARELAGLAASEAWRVEDKFSRYINGNMVDRINTANGDEVVVDEETARLIDFCTELFTISDGKFDITSGVLRQVWTFDGTDNVPDAKAVAAVLQYVGWHQVAWNGKGISLPAGMEIDLGGVGKEYAVDRASALIRAQSAASCLVNFGGDLAVTSSPRNRPAWRVGVESIAGVEKDPAQVINLSAGALATSGDTRRFLVKDGERYGHVINPMTGWPIKGAPASVTVAADSCVEAGMVCTLGVLSGFEAESFLSGQDKQFWISR